MDFFFFLRALWKSFFIRWRNQYQVKGECNHPSRHIQLCHSSSFTAIANHLRLLFPPDFFLLLLASSFALYTHAIFTLLFFRPSAVDDADKKEPRYSLPSQLTCEITARHKLLSQTCVVILKWKCISFSSVGGGYHAQHACFMSMMMTLAALDLASFRNTCSSLGTSFASSRVWETSHKVEHVRDGSIRVRLRRWGDAAKHRKLNCVLILLCARE